MILSNSDALHPNPLFPQAYAFTLNLILRPQAASRKKRLLTVGLLAAILNVALAASASAELLAETGANFEGLLSTVKHSNYQTGRFVVQLDDVFAWETRVAHDSATEGSTMTVHSETYKGREISVRPHVQVSEADRAAASPVEPELFIDNQPVFTIQNSSGAYIASGLAFDPQPSLVELAKRIIDRDVTQR